MERLMYLIFTNAEKITFLYIYLNVKHELLDNHWWKIIFLHICTVPRKKNNRKSNLLATLKTYLYVKGTQHGVPTTGHNTYVISWNLTLDNELLNALPRLSWLELPKEVANDQLGHRLYVPWASRLPASGQRPAVSCQQWWRRHVSLILTQFFFFYTCRSQR